MGLFYAAGSLRKSGELTPHELDELNALKLWFSWNLDEPSRFNRSRRANRKNKAISWFKASASRHIAMMWRYHRLLEEHGIRVDVIRTNRPGYVVYEDDFQIAAEPFYDTTT